MNSSKPIIGILTNILTVTEGVLEGTERIYVNRDYVNCITNAGAIPLLIPIISDIETIQNQIELVDALLLSGGQDVHPHYYQEEPTNLLGQVSLERDVFEIAAIKHAYALNKPILGICRGLQLINVVFGGSLYQDIHHHFSKDCLTHSQVIKKDESIHPVEILKGSKLSNIFEKELIHTNSFHHQSIKNIAPGFIVNAIAPDGIVEGIEKIDSSFVLGVQWHPEMMIEKHLDMQKLFNAFAVEAQAGISHE